MSAASSGFDPSASLKRTVRRVRAIAVKPATTFVTVIVSFAPTLNASRTAAEATPLRT